MGAHHPKRGSEHVQVQEENKNESVSRLTPRHFPQNWGNILIDLALLLAVLVAMSISRPIQSLYWDDLTIFSVYHNTSILEFIFNTFGDKFRPVSNIFLWLCYALTNGGGYDLYVFIISVNFVVAVAVYLMGCRIAKNRYIGLLIGVLYVLSRCSYYQLNQVCGIMEACATLFTVFSLFYMYQFLHKKSDGISKSFLLASLFTVLASFSHERFLVLYVVLFLSALINLPQKGRHRIFTLSIPAFLCVLNLAVRGAILTQSFTGTGGTNMLDSLNISQVLLFFFSGIVSLFGFNLGEAYLFGVNELELLRGYPFPAAPVFVVLAFLFALSAIALVLTALHSVLRFQDKAEKQTALKTYLLFLLFIGGTLVCACATVRFELRWLYVPYAGCLFLLAHSIGILLDGRQGSVKETRSLRWIAGALAVLMLSAVPLEIFYRTQIHRISYICQQVTSNALYSQTIGKYGQELYAHPIVILAPDKEATGMMQDYFEQFFDQYRFEVFGEGEEVPTAYIYYVDSVQGLATLEDESLLFSKPYIFALTPDNRGVYSVSEITNIILPLLQKAQLGQTIRTALLEKGFYPWEGNHSWVHTEQKAILQMRSGMEHKLTLTANTYEMNLPNVLRIYVNDQLIAEQPLATTDVSFTVQSDLIPEDTDVTVTLELEHITSDYEANGGPDRRPIGLTISDLFFE